MHSPTSNGFQLLPLLLFFSGPVLLCVLGIYNDPGITGRVLCFLLPWSVLGYELVVYDYATFFVTEQEIVLAKPLRKYSLFIRKRNRIVRIGKEEWDRLYFKKINRKGGPSVQLYFRKEQTLVYYFTATGLHASVDAIQEFFPEKGYVKHGDDFPKQQIQQLKKMFQERVL